MLKPTLILLVATGVVIGCSGGQTHDESTWTVDQRSYNLGGIGAFAEMVGAGVKQLALSAPLTPAEMDTIVAEAEQIGGNHGVKIFRETDFLVTDLFSSSLTDGKHVLLICRDSTHQKYLNLKAQKQRLLESGQYEGEARVDVARQFGMLLSYSEEKIASLLASEGGL